MSDAEQGSVESVFCLSFISKVRCMMRFSLASTIEEMEHIVFDELSDTWTVEQGAEFGLSKHGVHFNYGKDGEYRTVMIGFALEPGMDICLNNLHNLLARTMFKMHWEFSHSSIKVSQSSSWISFHFVEWPIEVHITLREV